MRYAVLVLISACLARSLAFIAPYRLTDTSRVLRNGQSSMSLHHRGQIGAALRTSENRMYVPPKYLMTTLKKQPEQKITVADLSFASGVELASAQKDLMKLAHVTGAAMQVTKQGDIIYAFPQDVERILLRQSYARRLQQIYRKVAPTMLFLFRASFGVCLVASLAVITVALTAATTVATSKNTQEEKEKEKKGRRKVEHHRPRIVAVLDLADIASTALRLARAPTAHTSHQHNSQELGYFDSFYSFVFGDGDPNTGELHVIICSCSCPTYSSTSRSLQKISSNRRQRRRRSLYEKITEWL